MSIIKEESPLSSSHSMIDPYSGQVLSQIRVTADNVKASRGRMNEGKAAVGKVVRRRR